MEKKLTGRGGPGRGQGRKSTGRGKANIYVTPEEKSLIDEFIIKIRGESIVISTVKYFNEKYPNALFTKTQATTMANKIIEIMAENNDEFERGGLDSETLGGIEITACNFDNIKSSYDDLLDGEVAYISWDMIDSVILSEMIKHEPEL